MGHPPIRRTKVTLATLDDTGLGRRFPATDFKRRNAMLADTVGSPKQLQHVTLPKSFDGFARPIPPLKDNVAVQPGHGAAAIRQMFQRKV